MQKTGGHARALLNYLMMIDPWTEMIWTDEIHHHGPYVSETCSNNAVMNVVRSGHDDQSHLQRYGDLMMMTTTKRYEIKD